MQCSLESYGAHEDANKLSFGQLQSALDAELGPGRLSVEEGLLPQMREAVAHVFAASMARLNPAKVRRGGCVCVWGGGGGTVLIAGLGFLQLVGD